MIALVIIGILVFIAGIAVSKSDGPYQRSGNIIKVVGILVVIIGLLVSSV